MFLGTYEPKLDDKGRLILPAKFREAMSRGMILARGQDRCLFAFSQDEFDKIYANISQAPLSSKEARDYLRVFMSGASDQLPDKQGRITIPHNLREWAGLEKDLAVIGAGTRIEIWDAAAWAQYLADQEEAFAQKDEEVIPGIF